jgi:hypothetical protein
MFVPALRNLTAISVAWWGSGDHADGLFSTPSFSCALQSSQILPQPLDGVNRTLTLKRSTGAYFSSFSRTLYSEAAKTGERQLLAATLIA